MNATDIAVRLRSRIVNAEDRSLLLSRFDLSTQRKDLQDPPNVGGVGRIRHFRRNGAQGWLPNPLPIDPAALRLGRKNLASINAQVFQLAACDWRCWYCFVPYDHLSARPDRSAWKSAKELVQGWAALDQRPPMLDLSGGQPELVPEWVVWTMEELESQGLSESAYLWSDDNLSTDLTFEVLSPEQLRYMSAYRNYGRVGCFKGFDAGSFTFNTQAAMTEYDAQFARFRRLRDLGLDLYGYVTLTHDHEDRLVPELMSAFVDRLQSIDGDLPLRTVPLQIHAFGTVVPRLDERRRRAIETGQYRALEAWTHELNVRFSPELRALSISDVPWANR
jgi:organic radical activating enzyme